ncbi:type II toxin-antitoxin system RelE/ParE family toxin [Phenylobacterium sp. SCN 70-31]|uniref:type II toxin-antitoxin system RelE/ParE family toxin n=1 Tax=Phenylobacterium sp. SCN 70-31 TaxID=1660129 RepID=UPI0025F22B32|nr:type II toxin-antitoxin system RelE/ParE family toxin [Phenylobacterium sp. SCN 70-31]
MKRTLRLSPMARDDLSRLVAFLAQRDPATARRAHATLEGALISLTELSERGFLVDPGLGLRELKVKFGRYGYAIQYRVDKDSVFVAQIFHVRETR